MKHLVKKEFTESFEKRQSVRLSIKIVGRFLANFQPKIFKIQINHLISEIHGQSQWDSRKIAQFIMIKLSA